MFVLLSDLLTSIDPNDALFLARLLKKFEGAKKFEGEEVQSNLFTLCAPFLLSSSLASNFANIYEDIASDIVPYDTMLSLMDRDDLNCLSEDQCFDVVATYIESINVSFTLLQKEEEELWSTIRFTHLSADAILQVEEYENIPKRWISLAFAGVTLLSKSIDEFESWVDQRWRIAKFKRKRDDEDEDDSETSEREKEENIDSNNNNYNNNESQDSNKFARQLVFNENAALVATKLECKRLLQRPSTLIPRFFSQGGVSPLLLLEPKLIEQNITEGKLIQVTRIEDVVVGQDVVWQPGTVRPTNDNGKFYSTSVSSKNNTKNVQHQENESGLPCASFKVLGRNSFSSNGNLGEAINYTIVPGLSLENVSYMRSFGVCYVHKYN